jgi:hypothetical protein
VQVALVDQYILQLITLPLFKLAALEVIVLLVTLLLLVAAVETCLSMFKEILP